MYCVADDGSKLSDIAVRELVLHGDFKTAYATVCRYITKRNLKPLHYKIIKQQSEHNSTLHLAPRGFGKSTVGDVDYCITEILRDGNVRIMIGSKTQTQAEAFLGEIKTHFEMNEDLIRVFGDLKSKNWSNREFTVNSRSIIKKEATVTALGASGAVVSKHFDIIVADDLVGFENARTDVQRNKLKEWYYSSLYPTLEPNGKVRVLGTRYSPLDLYEDFIKSGNYNIVKQQAIMQYCDNYKKYKKAGLVDKDLAEGEEFSLWEDKFDIETLKKIKSESGSIIFSMQYQNDTELAKGNIFKPQYFKYYESYEIDYDSNKAYVYVVNDVAGEKVKKEVEIYMGVDLAISESQSADYFCLFVIGLDKDGYLYGIDTVVDKLSFNNQLNTILTYGEVKYPMVMRIGVEAVAYQNAMVGELRRVSSLPILAIKTNKDKVTRATRRSALFENGKMYLHPSMHSFEEMLLLFPAVEHDDMFDGWELAVTSSDKRGKVGIGDRSSLYI